MIPLLPGNPPKIHPIVECYALCLGVDEADWDSDFISEGHLYWVLGFVEDDGLFPFGIELADHNRNALGQAFALQHFNYFFHVLN